MQRNGGIAIVKLLFSVVVILMHYDIPYRQTYIFEGAYIYVDFFFILAGFYLLNPKRLNRESATENAYIYFSNTVARFFPCVVVSSIMMLGFGLVECSGIYEIIDCVYNFMFQISFISQLMPQSMLGMGGILWYLSAMIIAGAIMIYMW